MADTGHTYNYTGVRRYEDDNKVGLFLLNERLESEKPHREDAPRSVMNVKEGKPGIDISLPSGVEFRAEDKKIIVSTFGMSREQLKDLHQFFYHFGMEGVSLPDLEDENFKQLDKEVKEETDALISSQQVNCDFIFEDDEDALAEANRAVARVVQQRKEAEAREIARAKTKTISKDGPSQEAILKYMNDNVKNTQKYKSQNYRINSLGAGWEMVFYKDRDQKNDGAKKDKEGHINPNYEFAISGEISRDPKTNKPSLGITFMTPKFGKLDDWMADEVMTLLAENNASHFNFNAGSQHKKVLFAAAAKKLIVVSGVKLKANEVEEMIKIAKQKNDDPKAKRVYYLNLAAQLKANIKKEGITDAGHPFWAIIKQLEDDARTEVETEKAKLKYKNFNQFYENNIMGKVFPDNAIDIEPESDAVREIASGHAYARMLKEYQKETPEMGPNRQPKPLYSQLSDDEKMKIYMKFYDEEVYRMNDIFSKRLDGLDVVNNIDDAEKSEKFIAGQYKTVETKITSLSKNLKSDLGVDVDIPSLNKVDYIKGVNQTRSASGEESYRQHMRERFERQRALTGGNSL